MESFRKVTGVAAPMLRINIDTDQIIPALFLGGTDAKGYGANLFHGQRCRADGSPNPASLHHGMKVRAGTKYVITKWFRERPWR